MEIKTTEHDNYTILKMIGSLSIDHSKEIRFEFEKLIELKKDILVDFTELAFISSYILSLLLTYTNKAKEKDLRVILFGVNEEIMKLFSVTQVEDVLKISSSLDDALHHLN